MGGTPLVRRAVLLAIATLATSSVGISPALASDNAQRHGPAAKLPGFLGIATVSGSPLVGARVQVFSRGRKGPELRMSRNARTNRHGGFHSGVRGLPRTYLVKVSGGFVNRRPFRQTLYALADSREKGVVVNPVTTVAAAFARQHPHKSPLASTIRIRALLGLPALAGGTMALGQAAGVASSSFSPSRFMMAANRTRGGLDRFARTLALIAGNPRARQNFGPGGPKPVARASRASSTAGGPKAHTAAVETSGVMEGVLASVIYSSSCDLLGPSLPSNMICGGGDDNTAVSAQISELQSSVNNITSTLNTMESQVLAVESQGTQQAYEDAFNFAGVDNVNTAVQSASSDINLLNASYPAPPSGFVPDASAATVDAQCLAVYPDTYVNSSNPYQVCADFLTQAATFSNDDYFASMYESLTGAANQPQDNLLTYTYQQVLTENGTTPVPQSTLTDLQNNIGSIIDLQQDAFAILANAQTFSYMVNTGDQPSCSNTTVSGTFPATTPLNVADVCSIAQTALFELSVESDLSTLVALPPAGAVSDPRTNYVWWGYPVDLSAATTSSGSYPFYPGAASGTYSISGGINALANNANGQSILAGAPGYVFSFADNTQTQTLTNGLVAPSGGTLNTALNSQGFVGLGTDSYGMTWANLGVGINANGYTTTSKWNINSGHEAYMTCGAGAYPNVSGAFQCTDVSVDSGGYYGDVPGVTVFGALATSYNSLQGTSVSSGECGTIPYSTTTTTGTPNTSSSGGVRYCTGDTYGLLVDTHAPAPGAAANGVTPPFWALSMLVGSPAAGVPATPVPPPS